MGRCRAGNHRVHLAGQQIGQPLGRALVGNMQYVDVRCVLEGIADQVEMVPVAVEAKVSAPGLLLASAMKSARLATGIASGTTNTMGVSTSCTMATKSFCGS